MDFFTFLVFLSFLLFLDFFSFLIAFLMDETDSLALARSSSSSVLGMLGAIAENFTFFSPGIVWCVFRRVIFVVLSVW